MFVVSYEGRLVTDFPPQVVEIGHKKEIRIYAHPVNPPILAEVLIDFDALKKIFEIASRGRKPKIQEIIISGIPRGESIQTSIENYLDNRKKNQKNEKAIYLGNYIPDWRVITINIDALLLRQSRDGIWSEMTGKTIPDSLVTQKTPLDTLVEEIEHSHQDFSSLQKSLNKMKEIDITLSYALCLLVLLVSGATLNGSEITMLQISRSDLLNIGIILNLLGFAYSGTRDVMLDIGQFKQVFRRYALYRYTYKNPYEKQAKTLTRQTKKELSEYFPLENVIHIEPLETTDMSLLERIVREDLE